MHISSVTPCQIITPLVEIDIWLPNPNPFPTPNPKPTHNMGDINLAGAQHRLYWHDAHEIQPQFDV